MTTSSPRVITTCAAIFAMNSGTRQALACDYAHTFLAAGNYETFAATPFESVFTSQLGLMMQEARDDVYKMYCESRAFSRRPICMCPRIMCRSSSSFWRRSSSARTLRFDGRFRTRPGACRNGFEFHRLHQLNWIDDLCDAVLDVAETRFYRGVAKVTRVRAYGDRGCRRRARGAARPGGQAGCVARIG